MNTLHPQFVTDKNGNRVSVILPIDEFKSIMEELEEYENSEDLKVYYQAKKEDSGERILLSDYIKKRNGNL